MHYINRILLTYFIVREDEVKAKH